MFPAGFGTWPADPTPVPAVAGPFRAGACSEHSAPDGREDGGMKWWRQMRQIGWLGGLSALLAGSAAAQGALVGRVVGEQGAPVTGAEVRVSGVRTRALTDSTGHFRLAGVSASLVTVGVRRVGFRPVADMVRVRGGDTVDVVLLPLTTELEPVYAQREADQVWERALRRYGLMLESARFGSVITARDIREREPQWMSDMLYGQVGFSVIGNGFGAEILGRSRCRPNMFIDGMFAMGYNLNNLQPSAVQLMVLYRNFTSLPSALQVPMADRRCGGIAIYTL
jgi:hypothetical protein